MSNNKLNGVLKLEWYWHIIICASILGLTMITSLFSSLDNDTQERQKFLQIGKLVAMSIQPKEIESLDGSEKDLTNPNYQAIKKRLTSIDNLNKKISYSYIFGNNKNGIFFYADSHASRFASINNDLATPGEVYTDSKKNIANIFQNGEAVVIGPETDKWGTFVSALAPIKNSSGKIIAVAGVDYDAKEWVDEMLNRNIMTFAIGLMFIVIYLIIIFLNFRLRKSEEYASDK